jgi:hypothetical protein
VPLEERVDLALALLDRAHDPGAGGGAGGSIALLDARQGRDELVVSDVGWRYSSSIRQMGGIPRDAAVTTMTWYDAEGRPLARSFRENPNFVVAPPNFSLKCYAAVFDIGDLKIEEDDNHNSRLSASPSFTATRSTNSKSWNLLSRLDCESRR